MSNPSDRPTAAQGPLHYAPRWAREGQQPRDPSATLAARTPPSRVETELDPDNVFPDRPFPVRDMRSPPVQALPPPPEDRKSVV